MREMIERGRAIANGVLRSGCLAWLAHACRRERRLDEASQAIAEAQAEADAHGESVFLSEIHRIAAEIALDESQPHAVAAERLLRQALDEAREQHALLFEVRAALALARLWVAQEGVADARALVIEVSARMPDDCPDRRDAHAFLADVTP